GEIHMLREGLEERRPVLRGVVLNVRHLHVFFHHQRPKTTRAHVLDQCCRSRPRTASGSNKSDTPCNSDRHGPWSHCPSGKLNPRFRPGADKPSARQNSRRLTGWVSADSTNG